MKTLWSRFLGMLFLGLAVWLALVTPLKAATGTYVMLLAYYEDLFWNYDFLSNQNTNNTNVDWTISMIFNENADVDKVKNIYWGGTWWANPMFENVSDNGTWPPPTWLSDLGTKDWAYWCQSNWAHHMRVYGRMYNLGLGYYVLASTHMDLNECVYPPQAIFGFSEYAEQEFSNIAQNKNYLVQRNSFYLLNPEPYRWEGNHLWDNDGYATVVHVP